MTNTVLRNLHYAIQKVHDLGIELEQGPRKLRQHQARVEQQQKKLEEEQAALKHVKVGIHDKELNIKDNLQKITKHQTQMGQVTTNKEYQALKHEIENEKLANKKIEDEILEIMLTLEERAKVIPEFEKAVHAAKEELKKAEAEMAGRLEEKRQILKQAEAEVAAAEDAMPPDLLVTYKRLFNSMGAGAISPLNGRSCTECYTEATSQQINDLKSNRVVTCKSCGRLLYLAE